MSSLIKKVPSSNGYDLFNGDFEEGIKHYRTYKDSQVASPEDGIGGTPQYVSITASNINPLLGNNSGIISKSLGNGQGEGVSIDFELSDGVLNNNALLSFIYTTSSSYVTGDIKLFLYDITNSLVYNISDTDLSSSVNVSKHEANIWFNATSKKYRLIFHIASTNTNAYTIKLDDVKINNEVKVIGSVIGEWTDYTLIVGAVTTAPTIGSTLANKATWRRVGSNVEIKITLETSSSGTAGSGHYLVSLPSGITFDLTKVKIGQRLGISILSSGSDPMANITKHGLIEIHSATQFKVICQKDNNLLYMDYWGSSFFNLSNASIRAYIDFSVPISGWGSNTNLITDFTEYASNSSSTDADDTTSFSYGPSGSVGIMRTTALTAQRKKRIRFLKPIQPNDTLNIEIFDGVNWQSKQNAAVWGNGLLTIPDLSSISSTSVTSTVGMGLLVVNSTDVDVIFGRYSVADYSSGIDTWGSGSLVSSIKWRVRKISNGNSAESIPSGIYESGSNANGSWIKYIDGTMECWHRISTNISTDYLFFNWTYPVPFTSEPIVSTKLSAGGSAVWALHSSGIGTASSVTNITYYKTQQGTYANPNYLDVRAIGKWNNALQVYAPGALVGITIEESGSNSNGSYIKYSDGTMICSGVQSATTNTNPTGNYNFPHNFLNEASIRIFVTGYLQVGTAEENELLVCVQTYSTSTFNLSQRRVAGSGSNETYRAFFLAIGRWK